MLMATISPLLNQRGVTLKSFLPVWLRFAAELLGMGVDELEPYDRAVIDDILPAEDLEKLFAAADETTIYWGGYDSNNRYSEQGDTVFFTRIDRENYEAERDS